MAVTTKKQFPNAVGANGQSSTVFNPVGIQLNNQDDLDVYVTLSGGTRVLQNRNALTNETAQSSHPQVNNTDGLYFPAVSAGTTLYNYQLSTDNNTITFNSALPNGATVFVERRTRDADSTYTTFASGSTIRATDLNNSSTESNFTAQDGRNKAFTIEGVLFRGDQPSTNFVTTDHIVNGTIVDADIASNAEIEVYKLKDGAANQVLVTQSDGTTTNWSNNLDLPGTLDVTGNVDFDSNLNVDGTLAVNGSSATFNATTTVNGSFVTNGNAQVDNINLDGNEIQASSGGLTIDSASGTTTIDDNLVVSGTTTFQNATASLNGSQIVTETASQTLTNKTLTTPVINDMSGTAVVTSGTSTSDNKVYSAKRSDELYYRKGTADDIEESGVPWSGNDSTIATTAAIDARIVDIVDDVGGFVPLVDEGEIPQYHPEKENKDTADRVGTILSIGTLTTTYTPSGGTVTIQASDLTNHSVNATITDCGSTVLSSGYGVLIETKAQTDSQYAANPSFKFHRLVPKATEVTTVAGKATEVTTVHTNINNINTVATDIANVNTVAADQADIGAVAGKSTEIGRLGTAEAVADMAILGTADVVADLNTLGTADVVADMNMLATSDVVADMNMLATSDVVSDMNDLATSANITAMSNCSGSISSINNASSNLNSINNFGDLYQVDSNDPNTDGGGNSLAEGDLYFNTSANRLKVYDGSSWVNGVEISSSGAVTTGNTWTGDNRYNDNVKAKFGTGSDLEIFHDGSTSRIRHTTSATPLVISNTANQGIFTDSSNFTMRVGYNGSNTPENAVVATGNGSVELYYDASKKFETTSAGATVTGDLIVSSNFPTLTLTDTDHNPDWTFYNGNGHFRINQSTDNINFLSIYTDAQWDCDVKIPHDDHKLKLGAGDDLWLYHTGTDSIIQNFTGELKIAANHLKLKNKDTDETYISCVDNMAVELYYDNSKKLETTATGATITGNLIATGNLNVNDNGNINVGNSGDLQLFHNGTNSFIDSDTGNLVISSVADLRFNSADYKFMNTADNETLARFIQDGAVELYHNNSKKFETTSTGIETHGNITTHDLLPDTNAYRNIGTSTNKWNAIHATTLYGNGANLTGINTDLVSDTSPQLGGYLDTNGHNIQMLDNDKLRIGTSYDLDIWHDGTDSHIQNTNNSGELKIRAHQTDIKNADNNETQAVFHENAAVELYYDNSKKLHTVAGGVVTTGYVSIEGGSNGQLYVEDNGKVNLGSSQDLKIHHNGTDSYIENSTGYLYVDSGTSAIRFKSDSSWANGKMAAFYRNGSVELYYDNSKKFETSSTGIGIIGHINIYDDNEIKWGNDSDLRIFHSNGNANFIQSYNNNSLRIHTFGTSAQVKLQTNESEDNVICKPNGATELYYDGSKKFETKSDGVRATGRIEAYPSSTSSVTAGTFYNNSTGASADCQVLIKTYANQGADPYIKFDSGGSNMIVGQLWAGTSNNKLVLGTGESPSGGVAGLHINGSGHITPDSNNARDLGSSSLRFRNIYTNDLNLSNEGSSNEVDNTWGNWTIQEGESDLFLKNNRSGKKYKFNLTEVS